MTHKELYYHLLREENLAALQLLMQEQNILTSFNVKKMELLRQGNFPYLLFSVEIEEVYAAQYLGLFLDIKPIHPQYEREWYYLPIVAFCETYDERIMRLINKSNSIAHELLHLKDLLAWIEEEPSFPDRVRQFSLNNVKDADRLHESIDLEIQKIFRLEPKALQNDFERGEKSILSPSPFGKHTIKYECQSSEEYVQAQLSDYIETFQNAYVEKFNCPRLVQAEVRQAVERYGVKLFGDEPYEKYREAARVSSKKIVDALLNRQFV